MVLIYHGLNLIREVKTKYNKMKQMHKEETVLVEAVFKYYKIDDSEGFYVSSLC